jgi:hypothetical protein
METSAENKRNCFGCCHFNDFSEKVPACARKGFQCLDEIFGENRAKNGHLGQRIARSAMTVAPILFIYEIS